MTGTPNSTTVALLLDIDPADLGKPEIRRRSTNALLTADELHQVRNATFADVARARDLFAAAAEAADQDVAVVNRLHDLLVPYLEAAGPLAELGDVVAGMPPADRAETLELLGQANALGAGARSVSDLIARAEAQLVECGPHDFGLVEYGCQCPGADPRTVIADLLAEVRRLRALVGEQ